MTCYRVWQREGELEVDGDEYDVASHEEAAKLYAEEGYDEWSTWYDEDFCVRALEGEDDKIYVVNIKAKHVVEFESKPKELDEDQDEFC